MFKKINFAGFIIFIGFSSKNEMKKTLEMLNRATDYKVYVIGRHWISKQVRYVGIIKNTLMKVCHHNKAI